MNALRRTDRARGTTKAREIAKALGLTEPLLASIETIAYMRGAVVIERPVHGSLARLVKAKGRALIVVSPELSGGRRRFAVAHELGHHELHDAATTLNFCSGDDLRSRDLSPEGEANAFAVELLMPRDLLEKRCDVKAPSLQCAQQIADDFQVSLLAAALRFVELSPEPCAIVVCRNGRVDWSMPGPDFFGPPARGTRVASETLAYEKFAGRPLPEGPEEVSSSAWLTSRFRGELIEHTIAVLNDTTITLLWQRSDA